MGILDDLLGGGQRQREFADFVNRSEDGTSIFGSPLAKAALAGIAALVVKRVMAGR